MTGRLQDGVALITGSDSGIGRATAIEFAKEGADVVINYLDDKEGAEHTRTEVEAAGRLAVFLASNEADYVTGSTYYMDGGLMQSAGQGA